MLRPSRSSGRAARETAAVTPPPAVMTAPELLEFLHAGFPLMPPSFRVEEVTGDGVVIVLPVRAEHERPGGTMSGPSMMALADVAAWLATVSRIGPVALSVTSSLSIDFLRKPALADLVATAELLKLGRRQSVTDVRIRSVGSEDIVARATVTYAIPTPST